MINSGTMRKTAHMDDDDDETRILQVSAEGLKEDADEDAITKRLKEIVEEVEYTAKCNDIFCFSESAKIGVLQFKIVGAKNGFLRQIE
eukprot:9402753-Pyramimonas_sp.AAC.1